MTANVPPQASFDRFLERDLSAYFEVTRVQYELLRSGPTQAGTAYPKFYLWVTAEAPSGQTTTGAVRVAAIERSEFQVTDFLSVQEIRASPNRVDQVFPAALTPLIKKRAATVAAADNSRARRGCYSTSLSPWSPQPPKDAESLWAVPTRVQLSTNLEEKGPAPGSPTPTQYRTIVPLQSQPPGRSGRWAIHDGMLLVLWTDGFTAVSAELMQEPTGFAGPATTFEDGNPSFHRHAQLTLTKVPCPTQ